MEHFLPDLASDARNFLTDYKMIIILSAPALSLTGTASRSSTTNVKPSLTPRLKTTYRMVFLNICAFIDYH